MIDMDAPVHTYIDPVLKRLNGTSMKAIWTHDWNSTLKDTIETVTMRQLMVCPSPMPMVAWAAVAPERESCVVRTGARRAP